MSNKLSEKIHESAVCCCVDVGSIIDNSETSINLDAICQTSEQAQALLAEWQQKAQDAAAEPISMTHTLEPVEQGLQLNATINFSCQAELLIFQLGQR